MCFQPVIIADVGPSLAVINDNTDTVTSQTDFDGSGMVIQGTTAYFITSANAIKVFNLQTQTQLPPPTLLAMVPLQSLRHIALSG